MMFKEYNQVKKWLDDMGISKYTINEDLTVDVDGNVFINHKHLKYIPIQFGEVNGLFDCSYNELESLKGSPIFIYGEYRCNNNDLKSLEFAPKSIYGCFHCNGNSLTSLVGGPTYVNGDYYCYYNDLTSLEGMPNEVYGSFDCSFNYLVDLKGAPKWIKEDINFTDNKITSLQGMPEYVGDEYYYYENNSLPSEVLNIINEEGFFKHQEEYGIWNDDGTLNEARVGVMRQDYDSGILEYKKE